MKYLLSILFSLFYLLGHSQTQPTGFPTQFNTGWQQWGYQQSLQGTIIAKRDTLGWLPRFTGTTIVRPQDIDMYFYDSTLLIWKKIWNNNDTLSSYTLSLGDSSNFVATTKWVKQQLYGTGSDNFITNNIGSGFRLVATPAGNMKTVFSSNTIGWDSTSNANGLTAKVDTTVIATQFDISSKLENITGLVAAGTNVSITGSGTSGSPYVINSSGGGSFSNNNLGVGFRWVATPSGNIRTVLNSLTLNWDSTNPTSLTANVDTSIIATQFDISSKLSSLNNVGLGFRIVVTPFGNIKTFFGNNTISIDSSSNTNALTFKVDTSQIATQFDISALTSTRLNNAGTAFRWAATPSGDIKTVAASNTILWDSTSNSNSLTAKADTSVLATQYDLTQTGLPAGSNTQVQFNDGGVFGADAGFTFNKTANILTTDSLRLLNARINENPYNADSVRYHGTSITAKVGPSSIYNSFSTVLTNKLNSIESNYGIPGATLLVQGVANIPTLPFFDRAKYRWIILEWGVNDIDVGGTDSTAFDTTYRKYIDTLIVARNWPASRVVILAPSYVDPAVRPTSTLAKQAQFRGATQSIASAKGTKWVDIYSAQLFRNPSLLLTDGIHPNDYGSFIYVSSIYNTVKDSVMSTDQNISINGYVEFQRLKLRNSDSADYRSSVIGQDSLGNVVRYTKDQIIQNSETLPTPQGSSISLVGRGLFGNVTNPNSLDKLQVSGSASAFGFRATASEPVGYVGAAINMFYASDMGFIYARDMPSNTQKTISLSSFGGLTLVGTITPSGGTEKMYVGGSAKMDGLQVTGSSLAGITGSGVEIMGDVSGSGYIGAFNRDGATAKPLTIQLLGGNTMIGTNTDNTVGKLQVAGKLTVSAHAIGSNSDSAVIWDRSTNEYKVALINGTGASQTWQQTLTTGSTLTGANTITGGNNSFTFNGMFNYRVNANSFVIDKTTATAPYSLAVIGAYNGLQVGYTPTPATYSKGVGITIDTNNNAGIGVQMPTTAPRYASGLNTYIDNILVEGAQYDGVTSITSNTTLDLEKYYIRIDATSGNVTVTLPAASTAFGASVGIHYVFKRLDNSGNSITITRAGSDTIDGGTSITLTAQYEVKEIICSSTSTWDVR